MKINDWDKLGPVLKVKETAKLLKISEYKVRDLVKKSKIAALKDGRIFREMGEREGVVIPSIY